MCCSAIVRESHMFFVAGSNSAPAAKDFFLVSRKASNSIKRKTRTSSAAPFRYALG